MEVLGYKCFNKDMTNRYGVKFEIGQSYTINGQITFGLKGNGYHMCKRLEDTLRYFNTFEGGISICKVRGSGIIVELYDEYNEYYDMYSVEKIEILKRLTRNDIIEYGLNLNIERAKRFITTFKLTENEILYFKEKFKQTKIITFIEYYQEEKLDAFNKKLKKLMITK